tara:strand:+ start:1529 stop:1744 length:216 start_codon:yes stop_codon:yes gene_type:complete
MADEDNVVVPAKRMTVTRLGHKMEELHESVDEVSNDLAEIKMVLKSLLEITLNVGAQDDAPDPSEEGSMYG